MGNRALLLVHSHAAGDWTEVAAWLDSRPEVVHWMYILPNTFLIQTPLDPQAFTKLFRATLSDSVRFLVVDTSGERNGWLHANAWELMSHPDSYPPPTPFAIPPSPTRWAKASPPVPPNPPPPPPPPFDPWGRPR